MVRGAACGRHAEPWSSSGAGARGVGRGASVGDPGQASRAVLFVTSIFAAGLTLAENVHIAQFEVAAICPERHG